MRFLITVILDTEKANAVTKAGKLGSTIQSILEGMKPEAAYFSDTDGQRSGYIICNVDSADQIPALAEPWFLAFNAKIQFKLVMIPQDLAKASASIETAVKNYAH